MEPTKLQLLFDELTKEINLVIKKNEMLLEHNLTVQKLNEELRNENDKLKSEKHLLLVADKKKAENQTKDQLLIKNNNDFGELLDDHIKRQARKNLIGA